MCLTPNSAAAPLQPWWISNSWQLTNQHFLPALLKIQFVRVRVHAVERLSLQEAEKLFLQTSMLSSGSAALFRSSSLVSRVEAVNKNSCKNGNRRQLRLTNCMATNGYAMQLGFGSVFMACNTWTVCPTCHCKDLWTPTVRLNENVANL